MTKINYRQIVVIPHSKNFSEIRAVTQEQTVEFDSGDEGQQVEDMLSTLQADALMLQLLYKFNDRQKIIFLYQALREAGYNLNHEDCAKTLSLTREHYMTLLKVVKEKARKVLQDASL